MFWRRNKDKAVYYGQVYVLSNPAMPGLMKVGYTRRTTRLRTDELSSATGVPLPFKIEFSQKVAFPDRVEEAVHHTLRTDRINRNREFFKVSAETAKKEIARAARRYGKQRRTVPIKRVVGIMIIMASLSAAFPDEARDLIHSATSLVKAITKEATIR